MQLLERFWTAVTYLSGILTLSPSFTGHRPQHPLGLSTEIGHSVINNVANDFPIFIPPSGDPDEPEPFVCSYPDMPDYEFCGNENSGCWLRHKVTGFEIGINTDYERIELTPQGQTRNVNLVLENSHWDADGQNFPYAKLFRNASDATKGPQYPGPWIQACWGDTLNINVYNNLMPYKLPNSEVVPGNGTTIHWHGVRMWNAMEMDGVNGVTQCPIAPEKSMTYSFRVMQYGSSWYHSHYSVQYADGALGTMTFHGPSSGYYDEAIRPIVMTDWGHNSAFEAVLPGHILSNKTILLNGRGDVRKFGYTNTTRVKDPYQVTFKPKRKYLMRLINASFGTHFTFSIDNHTMQVIEADYVPIEPYGPRQFVHVAIGQRLHVIVTALDDIPSGDGNFWIRTFVGTDCLDVPFGQGKGMDYTASGIVRYKDNKATPASNPWQPTPTTCEDEPYALQTPKLKWAPGTAANGDHIGGETFQVTFAGQTYPVALYALAKTAPPPALNPISIHINYSDPMQLNLDKNLNDPTAWKPELVVIPENFNDLSWVYLVLTSTDYPHPIHLHGHDFAIVATGTDAYDPKTVKLNTNNPARRDVVVLPQPPGYAVIAFKTDNPGSWLVHCHIAFHAAQGLGFQILERQSDANNMWPPNSAVWNATKQVCDEWIAWNSTALAEDLDSGI